MEQKKMKHSIGLFILAGCLLILAAASVLLLHVTRARLNSQSAEESTHTEPISEPAAAAEEMEDTPAFWFLVRYDGAALRGENGELLEKLPAGARLLAEFESGDYLCVDLPNGLHGWIHQGFVRAEDAALEQIRSEQRYKACASLADFAPQTEETYTVTRIELAFLDAPAPSAVELTRAVGGEHVQVLGAQEDYYLCRLCDGNLAYCEQAGLMRGLAYATVPGGVDLRSYLPEASYELLFASPNNITRSALYPPIPFLESETAKMLKEAYDIFKADGYTLKIYDAYRPKSAQYALYDIVQDSRFIGNPYENNSWHQLGRAVDISLICDATGEEVEMPTPMHTFSLDAARYKSPEWSVAARSNVNYLTQVMVSVGFHTINSEWWHFENSDPGRYLDIQINYNTIVYVLADEITYEY